MFKTLNILIISTFMLFGALYNAKAACGPCTLAHGMEEVKTLISVSGCPVTIVFEYGICSGSDDIIIEVKEIKIPSSCTGATMQQIVEQVSRYLLSSTHFYSWYFSPVPSSYNVSLSIPDCYKFTNMGSYILLDQSCAGNECCREYDISPRGDTINTIYPYTDPPNNCTTFNPDCDYNCEVLDEIEEGPYVYNPEGICLDTCDIAYTGGQIDLVDGSCTISITYDTRENCDGDNEIYISSIFTEGGSCTSYDSSDEVIKKAIREIMKKIVTHSLPAQDYIFNINKCYQDVTYGGITAWITCEYFSCCKFKYSAYKNGSGDIVNGGKTNIDVPTNDCSVISCTYICDDTHTLITGNFKPIFIEDERVFTTFGKVIPNPSNGVTKFVLESPDEGNITLTINDNLGNEIMSKNISKTSYYFEQNLDFSKVSNGTYYFKYELNRQKIYSGSFIISK